MRLNSFGARFLAVAALGLGLLLAAAGAVTAQTYPTSNAAYTPSATLSEQSKTSAGTVATFQINNVNTIVFRLSGDHATAVAHVEATSEAGTSATWSTIPALGLGPAQSGSSFSTNGLYLINVTGYKQARIVLDSIASGTFTVAMNGDGGPFPGDYNQDLGAVITFSAQAAGTVNSDPLFSYDARGASCRFVQTVSTATPSTVFSLQSYDAASGTWSTVGTSAATTADNTPALLTVYPGVATPTTAVNAHLGAIWRVQAVVTGGSGSTGTIGCQKLK